MTRNNQNDGYSWTGDGKLVCPQEVDTSMKSLPRNILKLLEVTGNGFIKQQEEESKSRYTEYAFKPVSREERQRIILAHEWVANVKDTCSRILGVENRHR